MHAMPSRSRRPCEGRDPALRSDAGPCPKRGMPASHGMPKAGAATIAAVIAAFAIAYQDAARAADAPAKAKTMADVLAASKPSDWRTPDPDNTLYLDLAAGRVVIELAPAFAPLHA